MDDNRIVVRIGTRGSALALKQADLVAEAICSKNPQVECVKKIIVTQGDIMQKQSLTSFGGKGVFVSEIERALSEDEIDIAVHSSKDLPMELFDGMSIAAVLKREDPRDVLVIRKGINLNKENLIIGSSSLRRSEQIKKIYSNCILKDIRGNVPTRIEKVKFGDFDGTILAMAGLKRLNLLEDEDVNFIPFDFDSMVPAGCQGIISIEMKNNHPLRKIIESISDEVTENIFNIERGILKSMNAGCHEPVGVLAEYTDGVFRVRLYKKYGTHEELKEFVLEKGEPWEKYI